MVGRAVFWALLIGGCGGPARLQTVGALSDPEALGILKAVAGAENMEAAPAQANALDPAVVGLASQMVDDSLVGLQRIEEHTGLDPAMSPAAAEMLGNAKRLAEGWAQLAGGDIDRAFSGDEIALHGERINLLSYYLLPFVDDAWLKSEVIRVTAVEGEHLARALKAHAGLH